MSTEATLIELVGIVSHLKKDFEEHREDDKKNFKYSHHMLENMLQRESEKATEENREKVLLATRLATLEIQLQFIVRLVWFVIVGVFAAVGLQIAMLIFKN